jgi:3-oxoacyl-[acyl-carrier-protein] synthase-3
MVLSGVEERRFWDRGVNLSEVGAIAARKALASSDVKAEQIGCLISTSVCKDYIEPPMASLIHGQLGVLPDDCINFDIGNACLGFLNGLSMAGELISKGAIDSALVVDAESSRDVTEATIARLLKPDADSAMFRAQFAALTLGSGAVAAVLTHKDRSKHRHRITGHVALTNTRNSRLCLGTPTEMVTDQRGLMEAGIDLAEKTFNQARETFGWTRDNIDLFVCHQVGATHQRALFERLGLDLGKAFLTYPYLGNVGPASVPLTLALARDRGRVQKGFRLALMGIGSGLNCSMMEVLW